MPFLHSCSAFYSEVRDKPTEACLAKTLSAESESPSGPRPLRRPSGLCTTPTMRSDSNNPKDLFDRDGKIWNVWLFPWCYLRLENTTWLLKSDPLGTTHLLTCLFLLLLVSFFIKSSLTITIANSDAALYTTLLFTSWGQVFFLFLF